MVGKAMNALWAIELDRQGRKRSQRPRGWRPSWVLLGTVTYEQLIQRPNVGHETATLIMQWAKTVRNQRR